MKTTPDNTIGIDLGDKKHSICVLDADGEIIDRRTIVNNPESLRRLAKKYPGALIAMEVGCHSPWISRFFLELDLKVLVANPRKLRAIYTNHRKSDEQDAEMLARIARLDPKLLHPIQHCSERIQRDLVQIKLRDNLVCQRVNIICSVRFTLKSLGIRLPSPGTPYFTKMARTALAGKPEFLGLIEASLRVIDELTAGIGEFDRGIEKLCEQDYPETARLRAITGVGAITALSFILVVGDPARFAKARDVGSYLGLIPKRDQSGTIDKRLGISKAGNGYVRRLLVGSAQYILGPFGPDCDLRRQGLALVERGGAAAKKKAAVAIARKLAVIMMTLLAQQSSYEPLRQAV